MLYESCWCFHESCNLFFLLLVSLVLEADRSCCNDVFARPTRAARKAFSEKKMPTFSSIAPRKTNDALGLQLLSEKVAVGLVFEA